MDVFTQLTQCFDVIQKLECPDPEIVKRYMKRFAKTIVKVLAAYVDIVKRDFENNIKNEKIVRQDGVPFCAFFHQFPISFYLVGYPDEQHPATSCPIREDVWINGRRKGYKKKTTF